MICSIHQPQSFPWLGYFAKIMASDVFIFLDNVQYKKNEYQNRNRIKYNEKANWLTIPVKYAFGQLINEVEINYKVNYQRKILNTLQAYYAKAPYYREYISDIAQLVHQDYQYLSPLNIDFVKWVLEKLNCSTKILISSEIFATENLNKLSRSEKLVKLVQCAGGTTYLSGVGGKDYLQEQYFTENRVKIAYQNFVHPQYQQIGENFVSHLSVLDLLFNEGEKSRLIIEQGNK